MTVNAIGTYEFPPRDLEANFHGNRLLYLGWDRHLMFCSPFALLVDPAMGFAEWCEQVLRPAMAAHPDTAKVDFNASVWLLNDQPWVPDFAASLDANGLRHKDMLRLQTPGLNGLGNSAS